MSKKPKYDYQKNDNQSEEKNVDVAAMEERKAFPNGRPGAKPQKSEDEKAGVLNINHGESLHREESQLEHADKIDIGCGHKHGAGFVGVDRHYKGDGIRNVDLNIDNLPFADNSANEIWAGEILEHFRPERLIEIMNDCFRVLKKGGKFKARVPMIMDAKGTIFQEAIRDPGHLNFWCPQKVEYFCLGTPFSHHGKENGIKLWEKVEVTYNGFHMVFEFKKP